MSEELKPCPFCGCEVGLVTGFEYSQVRGEHALTCVFLDDEPVATAEEWNTRAQPSDGAITNEGAEPVALHATEKMILAAVAAGQRIGIGNRDGIHHILNSALSVSPKEWAAAPASVVLPERKEDGHGSNQERT